jgi:hypothetical protein
MKETALVRSLTNPTPADLTDQEVQAERAVDRGTAAGLAYVQANPITDNSTFRDVTRVMTTAIEKVAEAVAIIEAAEPSTELSTIDRLKVAFQSAHQALHTVGTIRAERLALEAMPVAATV